MKHQLLLWVAAAAWMLSGVAGIFDGYTFSSIKLSLIGLAGFALGMGGAHRARRRDEAPAESDVLRRRVRHVFVALWTVSAVGWALALWMGTLLALAMSTG